MLVPLCSSCTLPEDWLPIHPLCALLLFWHPHPCCISAVHCTPSSVPTPHQPHAMFGAGADCWHACRHPLPLAARHARRQVHFSPSPYPIHIPSIVFSVAAEAARRFGQRFAAKRPFAPPPPTPHPHPPHGLQHGPRLVPLARHSISNILFFLFCLQNALVPRSRASHAATSALHRSHTNHPTQQLSPSLSPSIPAQHPALAWLAAA